jgi:hypothetical protein
MKGLFFVCCNIPLDSLKAYTIDVAKEEFKKDGGKQNEHYK